jgi:general secretion pathway protein J
VTRSARGFTLLEILVALAILAVVAVLAYRATAALADGETQLTAEAQRWRTLDALFSRLEADARAAVPRNVRSGARREPAWNGTVDAQGDAQFAFTRAGPEFALEPGMPGQRIGYRHTGDAIEVMYWPRLDNVGNARPVAYALARDIAAFRVGYLTAGGRWIAQWPVLGEPEIPQALRVEVTLADGSLVERWIALQ